MKVNSSGMVRIWDVHREKYRDAYPVDVKEMLKVGSCVLPKDEELPPQKETFLEEEEDSEDEDEDS